jgi:hypothetical protein
VQYRVIVNSKTDFAAIALELAAAHHGATVAVSGAPCSRGMVTVSGTLVAVRRLAAMMGLSFVERRDIEWGGEAQRLEDEGGAFVADLIMSGDRASVTLWPLSTTR